jgi:hypothetical protein
METTHRKVLSRVYGKRRGSIFTPLHFADLGTRKAVDLALARLTQKHLIQPIARGVYYYPKTHPVLGILRPDPDAVAKAIAGKAATRLQATGAYAANLLGLSMQVPAKIVYLTDGRSRTIDVGGTTIQLKHTTPRKMATAGRVSGLVIQALEHLGKKNVDETCIVHLRRSLTDKDKRLLLNDTRYAPAWIANHMRAIAESSNGNFRQTADR